MSDTINQLMDLAEDKVRLRGYHAVSFRDLADELNIKSSSVHYYFPQKQDLGVALVRRYSERVFALLAEEAKGATGPEDYLTAMCNVYRKALFESDRICLCCMLGAESAGLPEPVAEAVSEFLKANIDWLVNRIDPDSSEAVRRARAARIISTLHGAMLLANTFKDHSLFDEAVNELKR